MPVLINSMPKAGTNLVSKLFDISGVRYGNLGLAPTLLLGPHPIVRAALRRSFFDKNPVLLGLDVQVPISRAWLRNKLRTIGDDCYITGHCNWLPSIQNYLEQYQFKVLLVVRDPLDTLVSYCRYVASERSHFLNRIYSSMSFDNQVKTALGSSFIDGFDYAGVPIMLERVLGWANRPNVMIVRFEELVGLKGGGSDDEQAALIASIGSFTGFRMDLDSAQRNLFGESKTFRLGKIGTWRDELSSATASLAIEALEGQRNRLGYSGFCRE